MKFKKYPAGISRFAALSVDGHEFRMNLEKSVHGTEYVLDTNVIWFFQNPSDVEDNKLHGNEVMYFGRRFVAGNIRKSLQDIAELSPSVKITRAHKYELEVAICSELQVDYERVKGTLNDVFSDVGKNSGNRSLSKGQLAARIVDTLKEHFREDFKIVSDILDGKPKGKSGFPNEISEISPVILEHEKLSKLSSFLNVVLTVGAKRSKFSVRNDIRAISDVISENYARKRLGRRPCLVFLTLDQRLLEACRVAKWLKLPFTEHLLVENCQSFWLWRRDLRHSKNSKLLTRVTDDFLTKSRTILRDIDTNFFGEFSTESRTVFEPEIFKAAMEHLEAHAQSDEGQDLQLVLASMMDAFREVSLGEKGDLYSELLMALDKFFQEMRELLPSVQLSISSAEGYETVLKDRLERCGVDREAFLAALETDIEEHAKRSMEILGASSLLAPRRPAAAFNEFRKFIAAPPQFHRMPVPIQSTVQIVEKVAALVTLESMTETARYAELIKINELSGLRADLITAYLAVGAGNWKMAEAICTDATFYSGVEQSDVEHAAEIHMLACAVLRIYKTDDDRLTRAMERLTKVRSLFRGGLEEHRRLRVESEEMAIRANRFLFLNYQAASAVGGSFAEPEAAQTLLRDLVCHAEDIIGAILADDLKHKLMANAAVNVLTVFFCSRTDRPKLSKRELRVLISCLNASWTRISSANIRVSVFEEIVTLLAVRHLDGVETTDAVDLDLLERKRLDRDKYRAVVLNTSPFEQWVLKHFV